VATKQHGEYTFVKNRFPNLLISHIENSLNTKVAAFSICDQQSLDIVTTRNAKKISAYMDVPNGLWY
jgi:hypothetical protein